MSTAIVSVTPDSSVMGTAALLVHKRISELPVLRDGVLIGILSEDELLCRRELGTQRDAGALP